MQCKSLPLAFLIAAAVQVACQVYKLAYYSLRDRRFTLKYLVSAGGMPSAHSAFVASLATALGGLFGISSPSFSLSLVLAAIVIYDALRLRGAVQAQAKAINKINQGLDPGAPRLNEMLGHDMAEISAGIALGVGFALAFLLGGQALGCLRVDFLA